MAPLTFIVPWVLLSLVATPLLGAIITRTLGIEGDLDNNDDSIDSEVAADEGDAGNGVAPILGASGDGDDNR
jgi:hypothetical protein